MITQPTCLRRVIALTATLALAAFASMPSAAAASRPQGLSNDACDAFADYFTIEFLVAFASAFAGLGEELGAESGGGGGRGGEDVTKEDIQNTFHLVFSPKLEAITGTLADESPRALRKLFARQQAAFANGVDLLEDLGLTKRQLEALAQLDLSPDTDVQEVLGEVDISEAKLRKAAREFGKRADALDLERATRAQQRAFQQTGSQCGVFPESDLDCDTLVTTELAARLVGGDATAVNDDGSCTYTGPEDASGDEPVLIVDVYPNPRTFDRLVEQLQDAQPVDDGYVTEGFSSFSSIKTCGKTLYSQTDDATVVVALCPPDDGEVSTDDLAQVRDEVVSARDILSRRSG